MTSFVRAACLGTALLAASPSFAEGAIIRDPIIVTGRGLTAHKSDPAYDVVTLGRSRILDSASGRLEDVLRDVAGVQSFRRADSRSEGASGLCHMQQLRIASIAV